MKSAVYIFQVLREQKLNLYEGDVIDVAYEKTEPSYAVIWKYNHHIKKEFPTKTIQNGLVC